MGAPGRATQAQGAPTGSGRETGSPGRRTRGGGALRKGLVAIRKARTIAVMDQKKPIKSATVALFVLAVAVPLDHGRDWLLSPHEHTHQDGPQGNRDTGKIEAVARVTSFAADLSGLRAEDILRWYLRK